MQAATEGDLIALIQELRTEVRGLADRVVDLETRLSAVQPALGIQRATAAATPPAVPAAPVKPEASEEDMLVIAAAVAAFLGVKARIRQVRLIQSAAWAQVGRATIHASHRVH